MTCLKASISLGSFVLRKGPAFLLYKNVCCKRTDNWRKLFYRLL